MIRRLPISILSEDYVELGCGQNGRAENGITFLGVDREDYGQAVVWDIEQGLPFFDRSIKKIYSSHTFEHIHPEKIVDLFNECHRVLVKGGVLQVIVPHRDSPQAYVPTHLTYFDEKTFRVFEEGHGDCYKNILPWKIETLVTNERGDIHCTMTTTKL